MSSKSLIAARLGLAVWASFTALNAQAAQAAGAGDVSAAFGNTVMSVYPDGRSQKIWLKPDGTWDGLSRRGTRLAGKWNLKNDKVCLRQSSPPTLPLSYCTVFPAQAHVGVAWSGKDMAGTPITMKLVKGIETANSGS
jgi:hypothetical protein